MAAESALHRLMHSVGEPYGFAAVLRREFDRMDAGKDAGLRWFTHVAARYHNGCNEGFCEFTLRLASVPYQLLRWPRVALEPLFHEILLVEKLGGPSVKPYQPAGLWKELSGGDDYRADTGEGLYLRVQLTMGGFSARSSRGREWRMMPRPCKSPAEVAASYGYGYGFRLYDLILRLVVSKNWRSPFYRR